MSVISIHGAHAHNLQTIDLDIDQGSFVVLRGPSGSGKSSLALDVIHAESRRRLLEVLRLPGSSDRALPAVPVERIDRLPPTVAVAPEDGLRPDRSLVEMSDSGAILRGLFAERGTLMCPESGAALRAWTTPAVIADLEALAPGTRLTIGAPLPRPEDPKRLLSELRRSGFVRIRLGERMVRLDDVDVLPRGVAIELIIDRIKWGPDRTDRLTEAIQTAWKAGDGTVRVDLGSSAAARSYSDLRTSPSGRTWPTTRPEHLDASHRDSRCASCAGDGCPTCDHTGLGELARHTVLGGVTLPDLLAQPIRHVRTWALEASAAPAELAARLTTLEDLGLGSVPLDRKQRSLGRGEWRRAVLARALHLAVSPRLLVVDEPLSGLDPASASRVCSVLRRCTDQGATVLVIEHRPELLAVADRVITFGPGGGPQGGTVVADQPAQAAVAWSAPSARGPVQPKTWSAHHPHARGTLEVARDTWTVLTGASGAGTTRLAVDTLAAHFAGRPVHPEADVFGPDPRLIEPTRLAGAANVRSCVITAAGIWTHLRTLFAATRTARVRGLGPDAFTFNRPSGWCPDCEGRGEHVHRFGTLPTIAEPCATCAGGRLRPDLEDVRWRGYSARDLLHINIEQAVVLFAANPRLAPTLGALVATGLGHLPLGRPTESLSSGERRRFSVALAMARLKAAQRDPRPTLVVLDQPDAGLDDHTATAVASWMAEAIRGKGTLLTVAHHPALLAAADAVVVLQ